MLSGKIFYFHHTHKVNTMSLNELLLAELKNEAAATRRLLERVPVAKNDWKPHPKSMALGRLAMHVAEITEWTAFTLLADELDFSKIEYKPKDPETVQELLDKHDSCVAVAVDALQRFDESHYGDLWTLRTGEHIHFSLPKSAVVRSFAFNHLYHHRAQLGLYLRLLDVPIPGMYGPTADELEAMAAAKG